MSDQFQVTCLPTIRRMPMYYRLLLQLKDRKRCYVSSAFIAETLDLESIVVRKDMANLGIIGKPRLGFNVQESIDCLERIMSYKNPNDAFLIGAGHLGRALLGYRGFSVMGLHIVAGFDNDPDKIGRWFHGKEIFDVRDLPRLATRLHVETGILCVPEESAQPIADWMIGAGIKGIWNFTPTNLKVPESVVVQYEDLTKGLAVLIVKLHELRRKEANKCEPTCPVIMDDNNDV